MRLVIRISNNSLSFATAAADGTVSFEPYPVRGGMSMAANLRQAFGESHLMADTYHSTHVLLDSPVLLIPAEEFVPDSAPQLYAYAYATGRAEAVECCPVDGLSAVAAFAVNRDLRLVLDDNFRDVAIVPVMHTVWRHILAHSITGRRKMYVYIHDKRMDVFAIRHGRFAFANAYDASRQADAVYYLLSAWKQMGYKPADDELVVLPGGADADGFAAAVGGYITNVARLGTDAVTATTLDGGTAKMPFDMQLYFAAQRP